MEEEGVPYADSPPSGCCWKEGLPKLRESESCRQMDNYCMQLERNELFGGG